MDYICGKRLAPVLGEVVERLLRHNELRCDVATSKKLTAMSAPPNMYMFRYDSSAFRGLSRQQLVDALIEQGRARMDRSFGL